MRGLVVINKPEGITSYDVIRQIKKILGPLKIGHSGTLDPFASGVLLVLLGDATKINPFLEPLEKEYEFQMILGLETDTLDMTGRVIKREEVGHLTQNRVEVVLNRFTGPLSQVPPRFSAVSIKGRRAYELARKGIEFEPKPRLVDIHRLELLSLAPPSLTIKATVSKGTYIRALARDLGVALGSVATVMKLRRTRIGPFHLGDALELAELSIETIRSRLLPTNDGLEHLNLVTIKPEAKERFLKGGWVGVEDTLGGRIEEEGFIRVRDPEQKILVIARSKKGRLAPYRLIYADN